MFDPNDPRGMGQLTEEELALIMQMPDFRSQEEDLARQLALSDQLRIRAPIQRMDWASQAARGIQGIASGVKEAQAAERRKALGEDVRKFAGGLGRRRYAMSGPTAGWFDEGEF
jgi:hypothetical protein